MNRLLNHKSWLTRLALGLALIGVPALQANAQVQPASFETSTTPIVLTVDEAIQIALVRNYTIRNNRLNVDNASAQVREAWGSVYPQVDLNSSYQRNFKTANPFAGSTAGGFFSTLIFNPWLTFNEDARTDGNPDTAPISFEEYQRRVTEGQQEAGIITSNDGNPFGVENQFQNGVTISQTLYNGSAFAAIKGAQRLKDLNQRGVDRQEQLIVDQVRQVFYQARLAEEQVRIVSQSVERTRKTATETAKRVSQGVAPKFQRLSAEVDLANLETQLMQSENQTQAALDNLKFTLGIPIQQPVQLRGTVELDELNPYMTISIDDAFAQAIERRPDLDQARINVELREIDKKIAGSNYMPVLDLFANFSYTGSVPDNRKFTISDPSDPFTFRLSENKFFSRDYWNPSINGGFRLRWNLFNGFQTSSQIQQRQIAVERAEIEHEQLMQSVRMEVEAALRNVETARLQMASQDRNVERAELNYQYASSRLREGVATQLEERDASNQLDQSRLNYLQAVFDYVVARSAFETALGIPLAEQSNWNLTSNN